MKGDNARKPEQERIIQELLEGQAIQLQAFEKKYPDYPDADLKDLREIYDNTTTAVLDVIKAPDSSTSELRGLNESFTNL